MAYRLLYKVDRTSISTAENKLFSHKKLLFEIFVVIIIVIIDIDKKF